MLKYVQWLKERRGQVTILQVSFWTLYILLVFFGADIYFENWSKDDLGAIFMKEIFSDVGYVPWTQVEKNCESLNNKRHTTVFKVVGADETGVMFLMASSPWHRVLATNIKLYSKIYDDGLSKKVNNSYVTTEDQKTLYQFYRGKKFLGIFLVNTNWLNIVKEGRCYHLLESVSLFEGNEFDVPKEQ